MYSFGRKPTVMRSDGVAVQAGDFVYRMYHARWQTNAFYLREISSLNDLTNHLLLDTLVSRVGSENWHIDRGGTNGSYFYCPPSNPAGSGPSTETPIAKAWQAEVLSILRFGIKGIGHTELSWHGDSFQCLGDDGNGVSGRVTRDGTDRVSSIELSYSATNGTEFGAAMRFGIRYNYAEDLGAQWVPDKFEIHDGFGRPVYYYQLHRFALSQELRPTTSFGISSFLTATPKQLKIYSNGNWYLAGLSSSPAKSLIMQVFPVATNSPTPSKWFRIAFPVLTFLSLLSIVWWSKGRKPKTINPTQ